MPIQYEVERKSYLNETDKKVIRVVAYTLGTVVVGGGLFLLGRHIYRNATSNKEQNKSLDDNSVANLAKRLKMAFDNDGWWGTNVEAVRQAFVDLPSKEFFQAVIVSYKKQFQRNLIADLTDELTTTEYYEMQNILAGKPDKTGQTQTYSSNVAITYAKRLNAAVNYTVFGFPSTDEDAIHQVLNEIPNQQVWQQTKQAYQKQYGVSLEADLDDDLGMFDFSWRDIIKKKPNY